MGPLTSPVRPLDRVSADWGVGGDMSNCSFPGTLLTALSCSTLRDHQSDKGKIVSIILQKGIWGKRKF